MAEIGLPEFLFGTTWRPVNDLYGIFPMIVGSLYVTAGAMIVGVPGGLLRGVCTSRGSLAAARAPSCAAAWSCWPAFHRWSTASSGWSSSCPFVRLLGPGTGLSVLAASLML